MIFCPSWALNWNKSIVIVIVINKRYKTYQTRFLFCRLDHAPGVGLLGQWGCPGGKKNFLNMVMWHIYQINRDPANMPIWVPYGLPLWDVQPGLAWVP